MRKSDYMNDPLDFCLYPNEIVQRFGGKEVFVYGTDYECYGFFQLFAQHLKIKQVVNHFDSSDLLTHRGGNESRGSRCAFIASEGRIDLCLESSVLG